jgi:hypothetical protein
MWLLGTSVKLLQQRHLLFYRFDDLIVNLALSVLALWCYYWESIQFEQLLLLLKKDILVTELAYNVINFSPRYVSWEVY